jgi:hypothetical protein
MLGFVFVEPVLLHRPFPRLQVEADVRRHKNKPMVGVLVLNPTAAARVNFFERHPLLPLRWNKQRTSQNKSYHQQQ